MIAGKRVLGLIPARGGSKGLPRKNILTVDGKPLIAWTIEQGQQSAYIDRLILSSEDPEIVEIARQWGCETPFVRPQELASDEASGVDVVLHAMRKVSEDYDYLVLLQPTSPLRMAVDIDNCIRSCHERQARACVSVSEAAKSPLWMYFLDAENRMNPVLSNNNPVTRRQDLPKVFELNGAVYVVEWDWFLKNKQFVGAQTVACIMPSERSLDIDTSLDLDFFQYLVRKQQRKNDD